MADLAVARGRDQVKYLEIEVALDETTPEMKPGMTVRVDQLLSSEPDQISIPIEAIHRKDKDAFVWVKGLTGWSQQAITTDTENDTHVVVEGLAEGSLVALVDPHQWTEEGGRPAATDLHAEGRTLVMVTHDPAVAAIADWRVRLEDGKIVAEPGYGPVIDAGPGAA